MASKIVNDIISHYRAWDRGRGTTSERFVNMMADDATFRSIGAGAEPMLFTRLHRRRDGNHGVDQTHLDLGNQPFSRAAIKSEVALSGGSARNCRTASKRHAPSLRPASQTAPTSP